MDRNKVLDALRDLVKVIYEDVRPGLFYEGDLETEIRQLTDALCPEPEPVSQASGHEELYQTLRQIFKAGVDGNADAATVLVKNVMELFANTQGK